ncbi:MAG: methyltransferase domain-containing protein [Coriobacteriia bacterium]|nr:methyltransferase domain-containing protein [Coriobacteriia bacterium]
MLGAAYEHEKSYRKSSLGGFIHRSRLNTIIATLRRFGSGPGESWADFGCSNGFIIDTVLSAGGLSVRRVVGYDHSRELLEIAAARRIDTASFEYRDMNAPPPQDLNTGSFGLVTCFETLEHVADYKMAFQHLVEAAMPGGVLVVAVPNETGLPGLLKLWGRYAMRRNPYGDFLARSGRWAYTRAVLTGSEIESFRQPSTKGYGPHLGFDFRRLAAHVHASFVSSGRLALIEQSRTILGMNVILVYEVRHEG